MFIFLLYSLSVVKEFLDSLAECRNHIVPVFLKCVLKVLKCKVTFTKALGRFEGFQYDILVLFVVFSLPESIFIVCNKNDNLL